MLRRLPRPERHQRGDLLVAVVLVVVLAGAAVLYGLRSPAASTTSTTTPAPPTPPPAATAVPRSFTELWRAPSAATPLPLAAGAGVVVADGSTVSGRDAGTGAQRWSYTRNLPLCTVAVGYGKVLAAYRNDEYCSELTSLNADSGTRGPARTLDARPGTRLIGDGPVVATGQDYVEAMRSDLVRTTEYGAVRTLEEPDEQPRTGCSFSSVAAASGRIALVEDCPGDGSDRLTVLRATPAKAEQPEVELSQVIGVTGSRVIAVSADQVALSLPGAPRLLVLDRKGSRVSETPLAAGAPVQNPQDGVARTAATPGALLWWTGAATVALDPGTLLPLWTLPTTLGPGTPYAGRLLVPVAGGLADVDLVTGRPARVVPVDRSGYTGGVAVAAQGDVLLEQRGTELVALGPQD